MVMKLIFPPFLQTPMMHEESGVGLDPTFSKTTGLIHRLYWATN
jgi:hypothetical protein